MAEGGNSGTSFVPTIIVALLAAWGLTGGSGSSSPAHGHGTAPANRLSLTSTSADQQEYPHSAAALLESFLATSPIGAAEDRPWLRATEPPEKLLGDRDNYSVKFLIATLPSPASPALRSEFDNDLDATVSAASDEGYTLDSFDLPWQEIGGDKTGVAAPTDEDNLSPASPPGKMVSLQNGDKSERWQTQAGIILFRSQFHRKLLVLFVIGETQTRGIDKLPLRDALDQIVWLWPQPNDQAEGAKISHLRALLSPESVSVIDIIGPSFSGSADSLRNELESWRSERTSSQASPASNQNVKFNFFVNSATAINRQDLCESPQNCSFHEFTIPDARRWSAILPDLESGIATAKPIVDSNCAAQNLDWPIQIALLREESGYGGTQDPYATLACRPPDSPRTADPFISMPFPPQVSSLRTALENRKGNQLPAGPQMHLPDVPEAGDNDDQSMDVLPSFSTRSPSYDQLMLNESLGKIAKQRLPYAGIIATDVSDLIFLAASVRDNSPDTTLFTVSSDLRMLRHAVNPDLYGMVVFSSHPLFPGSERSGDDSPPSTLLREFPSEGAEGTYYATSHSLAALLDQPDAAAESHDKVLWTSVVGRDQLWPLSFQAFDHTVQLPHPRATFTKSFLLLYVAIILFCGVSAVWIVTPDRLSWLRPGWMRRLTSDTGLLSYGLATSGTCQYFTTLSAGLLTASLVAVTYLLLPKRDELFRNDITLDRLFWVVLVILTVVCILLLLAAFIVSLIREWTPAAGLRLVFSLLALSLALVFCHAIARIPREYVPLLLMRSETFGSGVSPMKVMFFVGLAALALSFGHIRQVALIEDSALPTSGFLGLSGPSFQGITKQERRITDLLRMEPWNLPGALPLILFIGLQTLFFCWKAWWFRYALDGPAFGWFWVIVSTIIYGGLFFLLLRFLAIWMELHRMLRRLYFHPTRGCYQAMRANRLPEIKALRLPLLTPAHDLTCAEYCLERARELLNKAKELVAAPLNSSLANSIINSRLGAMVEYCEGYLGFLHKNSSNPAAAARNDLMLQEMLAELSAVLSAPFERVWRLGLASSPPDAVAGEAKEHELVSQAEYFIASRVLDFLRRVYSQMTNLVGFAVAGVLAQMLACSAYPMPAMDTLLILAWLGIITAVVVSLYVFVQMNIDMVISMLQGTSPGYFSLTSSFTIQLLFLGVIPILTMLGAQFPHSLGAIVSWVSGVFSHSGGA